MNIKKFLWSLSGILAAILMLVAFTATPAGAVGLFVPVRGIQSHHDPYYKWENSQSSVDYSTGSFALQSGFTYWNLFIKTENNTNFNLNSGNYIELDFSMTTRNWAYKEITTSSQSGLIPSNSCTADVSAFAGSFSSKFYDVLSSEITACYPQDSDVNSAIQIGVVHFKVIARVINNIDGPISFIVNFMPSSNHTFTLSNVNVYTINNENGGIISSIEAGNQQAHQDSQAQLDFDKQQAQKEEEQRKEDEKKAQDSGDQAQNSADDSQSDVNSATGNFFTVINGVKDSILQSSNKGNCKISGDFGFFDSGQIDLCTGGSKIKNITSVVGTVMLTFFVFNAAITVIEQFYDLYMEYMR